MSIAATKDKNFLVEEEIPCVTRERRIVVVQAQTKEEAMEKRSQEIKEDSGSVVRISKRATPIPVILFLGVTVLISYFDYHDDVGFDELNLYPSIISLVLSVVVYSAFVIRIKGLENMFNNTVVDVVISVLLILVMSIFIEILSGDASTKTGIIGKILEKLGFGNSYILIIAAAVLSWLGFKQICGFVWLAVIFFGLTELGTCGIYMGKFIGSLFILSAFLGCIFYLKYEGRLIINSFQKLAASTITTISSDIGESQKLAQKRVGKTTNTYATNEVSGEENV